MAFRYPVPAQHAACEYVCAVARCGAADGAAGAFQGRQSGRVCGDERARAGAAACHGGVFAGRAGVPSQIVGSDPYRSVMPLIVKIVPDSSIVGMILETPEPMRVVRSDQKGVMHVILTFSLAGLGQ